MNFQFIENLKKKNCRQCYEVKISSSTQKQILTLQGLKKPINRGRFSIFTIFNTWKKIGKVEKTSLLIECIEKI